MITVALCYFHDDGELKKMVCFGKIQFLEQYIVSSFVGQCFKSWSRRDHDPRHYKFIGSNKANASLIVAAV
jgi:hypothetical protein